MSPDLELALRLADAADAISLARFRSRDLVVETKPDLTPVTEADREVEHDAAVLLERDQGRPDGNAARVVPRPVDRVDDPPSPARAGRALLLAEDRVAAALGAEHRPQLVLDLAVGLRHRRQVGLGLDDEVTGPEAREGDRVRRVREPQRELEIGAHPAHPRRVPWRRPGS